MLTLSVVSKLTWSLVVEVTTMVVWSPQRKPLATLLSIGVDVCENQPAKPGG